jgi:hypothetical protein
LEIHLLLYFTLLLLFVLDLDCGDTGGTGATSFADAMVK